MTIKVPAKTMQPEMFRGTDLEVALVRMSSEDVVRVRLVPVVMLEKRIVVVTLLILISFR